MNFDESIAVELGVECAILLSNIQFWVKKNKANGEACHNHEGKFWTYNSAGSFAKLFPYWKERTIYSYLEKLEKAGYVLSGNFNKFKYDRTKWYTTDGCKNNIYPLMEVEVPKNETPSTEICGPIPDITTNINTDINSNILASTPSSAIKSKSSKKVKAEVVLVNKEGVQSMLLYFYATLLPGAPNIFSPTNRKALDGLITAHGLKDVRETIDKSKTLLGVQYAPQISNISVFATKYLTIKNYQSKTGYQPVRHF